MDFYALSSMFDICGGISAKEFYDDLLHKTLRTSIIHRNHDTKVAHNQALSEALWYDCGAPYYKIWPTIIPVLSCSSLNIPAKYLSFPSQSFVVRFPMQQNPWKIDNHHCIRAALVCRMDEDSIVVMDSEKEKQKGDFRILVWIDIGERDVIDDVGEWPVYSYVQGLFSPNDTIEEGFNKLMRDSSFYEGVTIPTEMLDGLLRLIVSVCLVSTDASKIIEADSEHRVFNKHQLRVKSRRGWTIGRRQLARKASEIKPRELMQQKDNSIFLNPDFFS